MKMVLLLMAILTFTSCAAKKLAIDNADGLITYQIQSELSLNSAQKKVLSQEVSDFLNNTKPQVKEIHSIIEEIDLKNPQQLARQYEGLEQDYLSLAGGFSLLLARRMAEFNPEQQKVYFQNQNKKNKKLIKAQSDQSQKTAERFKYFLGSINPEQEKLANEYKGYFSQRAQERIVRRQDLQKTFESIYQDVTVLNKEKEIHKAMVSYQKESLAGNKNLEFLAKLLPTITSEQHTYFNKKKKEIVELVEYYLKRSY